MEGKGALAEISEKLIADLAVLEQEKDRAIDLPQFEKLTGFDKLYSIRHPIEDDTIILLTAF